MGKYSEYNREKLAKQKQTIQRLRKLLPEYAKPFLDDKELTMQPNTVIAYARDLHTFFEFLVETNPALAGMDIDKIPKSVMERLTYEDINEYQRYLNFYEDGDEITHQNQERAIARRMAALRGFFHYASTHDILSGDPTIGASKRKKIPKKEIIRMNSKEVNTLLSHVENNDAPTKRERKFAEKTKYRDTAILTLMLGTGIRVSECVGLDLNDINFKDMSFTVVRKGGDESTLYMNDQVAGALKDYIDLERPNYTASEDEKALFLSSQKRRITVRSVENMVKKFAQRAVPGKHITCHKLRSTYGTQLYLATSDIKLVADCLGHRDISTTSERYIATLAEHKRKAASTPLYAD